MRWSCTDGGGTSDPIPTTLLAFPPASLVQAVGTELAARMAAAPGPPGSEVAEGGGWGTRLVLIPCLCARLELERSTLLRAVIPY